MRRRKLIAAVVGLAVVAAGAVALWPDPSSRITRENVDRIREGMTRAEVVAILGPPGDYSSGPVRRVPRSTIVNSQTDLTTEWWVTDTGLAESAFDSRGLVVAIVYDPCERIPQDLLDNLKWRVEHLVFRWFKKCGLIVE
jgi:hypothetical protein